MAASKRALPLCESAVSQSSLTGPGSHSWQPADKYADCSAQSRSLELPDDIGNNYVIFIWLMTKDYDFEKSDHGWKHHGVMICYDHGDYNWKFGVIWYKCVLNRNVTKIWIYDSCGLLTTVYEYWNSLVLLWHYHHFLNTHNRYPIVRPHGWAMRYLLCVQNLMYWPCVPFYRRPCLYQDVTSYIRYKYKISMLEYRWWFHATENNWMLIRMLDMDTTRFDIRG